MYFDAAFLAQAKQLSKNGTKAHTLTENGDTTNDERRLASCTSETGKKMLKAKNIKNPCSTEILPGNVQSEASPAWMETIF